jgi:hypothetical protein
VQIYGPELHQMLALSRNKILWTVHTHVLCLITN